MLSYKGSNKYHWAMNEFMITCIIFKHKYSLDCEMMNDDALLWRYDWGCLSIIV